MTRRFGLLAVLFVAVLAACGGGTGATPGPAGTGATGTQGPGAPTTAAGGVLADPCSVLTVEEAQAALGSGPLVAIPTPGDPASCAYNLADGGPGLSLNILQNGAATQFQGFIDAGSSEPVEGIGDQALFERSSRRLLFMAAGTLVYIFPQYVGGADAAFDASKAIGVTIAARLTGAAVPSGAIGTVPPVVNAANACDLLSADEAAGVLDRGAMTAQSSEYTPQFCTFSITASTEIVLTVFLQRTGGADAWEDTTGVLTTEPVAGVGEKAAFESYTNTLYVLRGDAILNVANVTIGLDPATGLSQDKALMTIMLSHL